MIEFGIQRRYQVSEQSEVAPVRRAACALAENCGFSESRTGEVALVVTEAATNILKFAKCGEILIRSIERNDVLGIEVLVMDSGPGIANISHQMEDGNSTVGTYGLGLGTIERLSDEFDIYSSPDNGVVLFSIMWQLRSIPENKGWEVGGICLPIESEIVSGDAWKVRIENGECALLISDGLGHGQAAADASNEAVRILDGHYDMSANIILQKAHTALRGTRGAAVAVACIDRDQSLLNFAGVGNIAVCVLDNGVRRHLISHNGIVGNNLRKVQEFNQSWNFNSLLIGHSDGINTRWDLDQYPGLSQLHPNLIASILYRDFSRGRDDVSVLVVRDKRTLS